MSDILSILLKRYGVFGAVAALVFACATWTLAHYAAAPGTSVSILWGLVEYTKVGHEFIQARISEITAPIDPSNTATAVTKDTKDRASGTVPLSIQTIFALDPSTYKETIQNIRAEHKLRSLREIEAEKNIEEAPNGTYFFVIGGHIGMWDFGIVEESELVGWASNVGFGERFEVHRDIEGAFWIIAFASEADASRIANLNGQAKHELIITCRPWSTFTTMVRLPILRLRSARERLIKIEEGSNYISIIDISIQ